MKWWRAHRDKAPDALENDLAAAERFLASSPNAGEAATNTNLSGVRRLLLKRVRYFLYYRLSPDNIEVQVLALWHARRGPGPKL